MQKSTDIWIIQEGDGYGIDVVLDGADDIDVVLAGTSLFSPFGDLEPVIKDYLENPNDLTTIYIGNTQVGVSSYTHIQGIGAATWYIAHSLGRSNVIIQCFDNNGQQIHGDTQNIDSDNSIVRFGLVFSGRAECR